MANLEHKAAFSDTPGIVHKGVGVDRDAHTVSGYASVSSVLDRHGDVIIPGALASYLGSSTPKVMWQHEHPMGVSEYHVEDAYGLRVIGKASETAENADRLKYVEDGAVDAFSIGYRVTEAVQISTASADDFTSSIGALGLDSDQMGRLAKSMANGRLAKIAPYGVRAIKRAEVVEYSPVTIPANPWALIDGSRKSFADLSLPFADGLADGSPVDPAGELVNDPDVNPTLVKAAFLLPDTKGIPLVEMIDGVPMHTRRALRAAVVAVKDGALRDHGLSDGEALAVLGRLMERAGMSITAPSLKSIPLDLSPLRSLVTDQKRSASITRAAKMLRTLTE